MRTHNPEREERIKAEIVAAAKRVFQAYGMARPSRTIYIGIASIVFGIILLLVMKKQYKTVVSQTAKALPKIHISAGKIGAQLELAPDDLCRAANAVYGDIIL